MASNVGYHNNACIQTYPKTSIQINENIMFPTLDFAFKDIYTGLRYGGLFVVVVFISLRSNIFYYLTEDEIYAAIK